MKIEEVHICRIRVGDLVLHEGQVKTVTKTNIGGDAFMGRAIWGDCYHSGHKKVKRVTL